MLLGLVWIDLFNHGTTMHAQEIPSTSVAAQEYRGQGESLSEPHAFGQDPLNGNPVLQRQRRDALLHNNPHSSDFE